MKKIQNPVTKQTASKTSLALQQLVSNEMESVIKASTQQLVIGFSGGIDSTALLYLLNLNHSCYPHVKLKAVYVNHGLQKESNYWQSHCQNICEQLSISFQAIQCCNIQSNGEGLEKAARDARFAAFDEVVNENDILCLGHHANDQTETVLFRLFRGTGVHGLSGINITQRLNRINIVRPLLKVTKYQLEQFLKDYDLSWIEDRSNQDSAYDRNFLRNQLIPIIEKRWPEIHKRISKSTALFREQHLLLDELAEADARKILSSSGYLKMEIFSGLSLNRSANFLSWWTRKIAGYSMSRERILTLCNEIKTAKDDSSIECKCGGQLLIQSGCRMFFIPEQFFSEKNDSISLNNILNDVKIISNNEMVFTISQFCTLHLHSELQNEIVNLLNNDFEIHFGVSQSSIVLENREHSTKVKKLFQQSKIPSWLKSKWPVLTKDNKVVSILGVGIDSEFSTLLKGVRFQCLFDWGQGRHFKI